MVETSGDQPPSGEGKIDPAVAWKVRKRAARRRDMSRVVKIAVAVIVGVICLGGVAEALVFTVFRTVVTEADNSTTTTTPPDQGNPLHIVRPSTVTAIEYNNPMTSATTTFTSISSPLLSPLRMQCGRPAFSPVRTKIVGGVEARPHSWPWLAVLVISSKKRPDRVVGSCGGALISDQWVLTAAHCTSNLHVIPDSDVSIEVHLGVHGRNELNEMQVTINAGSIFTHPEYATTTQQNDISLLKLASKVTFTDRIRPVCLPREGESVAPGNSYFVAGWGTTLTGEAPNVVLRQTQLPVVNDGMCSVYKVFDAASQICAGWSQGQKAPCMGDSGGPLMKQQADGSWVAVGLVSYAEGCAVWGKPDALTDVAFYRPWLDQTVLK